MKKLLLIIFLILFYFIIMNSVYALSVAVHVPEKYTDVQAGERFYFEIEVKYPENPMRKDLRLEYEIKKDDKIVASSKVLKAIETQASFVDYIVIPESADRGMYQIVVKVRDYKDLDEEASASFNIIKDESSQIKMYFFILLGVMIVVGLLISWQIFRLKEGE